MADIQIQWLKVEITVSGSFWLAKYWQAQYLQICFFSKSRISTFKGAK